MHTLGLQSISARAEVLQTSGTKLLYHVVPYRLCLCSQLAASPVCPGEVSGGNRSAQLEHALWLRLP
jgi:hypothetical protein